MIPTIGRIVHYVSRGGADGSFPSTCRAAVVTEVPDAGASPQALGLAVLTPDGLFFDRTIPYHAGGHPGSWHWPEGTPEALTGNRLWSAIPDHKLSEEAPGS